MHTEPCPPLLPRDSVGIYPVIPLLSQPLALWVWAEGPEPQGLLIRGLERTGWLSLGPHSPPWLRAGP